METRISLMTVLHGACLFFAGLERECPETRAKDDRWNRSKSATLSAFRDVTRSNMWNLIQWDNERWKKQTNVDGLMTLLGSRITCSLLSPCQWSILWKRVAAASFAKDAISQACLPAQGRCLCAVVWRGRLYQTAVPSGELTKSYWKWP